MENNQQPLSSRQQTDQPRSILSTTSHSPSKTFIILIVLILITAFGIGGYFLGVNQNPVAQNQPQPVIPTPQPSPTPTPLVLPTVDPSVTEYWKTYTNIKYGYSIKYPPELVPYGIDKDWRLTVAEGNVVEFRDSPRPTIYYDPVPGVFLIRVLNKNSKEFKDEIKKYEDAAQQAPCGGCPKKYKTIIDGIEAIVYEGYGGYQIDKIIIIEKDDSVYIISYDVGNDPKYAKFPYILSNQILSTFQFSN